MPRLDAGISKMKLMQPRNSHSIQTTDLSCLDISKANSAYSVTLKPKPINLTNFKSTKARDDFILKQDDRWYNNQLENTKEERQLELEHRASQYKNPPLYFGN